jgi:hypothetical protein
MPHVIEPAKTSRAKCRGCGVPIAAGQLRFGERVPNPFGEEGTETTHWFHVACAALMRPEAFLEALPSLTTPLERGEWLEREARLGVAHRRLPRVAGVERAPSGRAACRHCRAPIDKNSWRIPLRYYEDGRFVPSGFVHLACAGAYFETTDLIERLRHFSSSVTDEEAREIAGGIAGSGVPRT